MTGYRNFWKSVTKLGFGNFVAQILSIFSLPFITRTYSPEEFGVYIFVISICTLLIPVATLRFETLIVLSRDQNEVEEITLASVFFSFWISCISSFFALIYFSFFEKKTLNGSIAFAITLGIILFVQSVNIVYVQTLLQQKNYLSVARSSVTQNASTPFFQLIFGIYNKTYLALGIGYSIGRLLSTLSFYKINFVRSAIRNGLSSFKKIFSFKIGASRYLVGASILEVLIVFFPLIILSLLFGSVYSGYLGVAQTLTYAPLALISGAISNVMLSSPPTLVFQRKSVIKLLLYVSVVFFLFALIMNELPENYMGSILGKDWAEVGNVVRILVIPSLISMIYQILSSFVLKNSSWNFHLNANLIRFLAGMCALLLSHLTGGSWLNVVFAYTYAIGFVQIILVVAIVRKFIN